MRNAELTGQVRSRKTAAVLDGHAIHSAFRTLHSAFGLGGRGK